MIAAILVQIDLKTTLIWGFFFFLTLTEAGFIRIRQSWFHRMHHLLALNPVITSLGRWSYSTYLIHIPLFSIMVGAYVGYVGPAAVDQNVVLVILLISLPIILVLSAALYRWIELPPIRLGKHLIARRRTRPVAQEAGAG